MVRGSRSKRGQKIGVMVTLYGLELSLSNTYQKEYKRVEERGREEHGNTEIRIR